MFSQISWQPSLVAICLIWVLCCNGTTIDTPLGKIIGNDQDGYVTFNTLPYTEYPMTGDNRWKLSELRVTPYNNGGPFDATIGGTPSTSCTQQDSGNMWMPESLNEDCLTLDIWTPNVNGNATVIFWIHGGGFRTGNSWMYPGEQWTNKNIVFVSIQYRLRIFGYLPMDEIKQENGLTNGGLLGGYDQYIALKYVNKYISYFGGNPNDIHVFGESAGGLSACALMHSELAKGLFKNVVIESGACNGPWAPYPTQDGKIRAQGYILSNNLTYNLTYLRNTDVAVLLQVAFAPTMDEYVVNDNFLSNPINAEKVLIGVNSIDSLYAWPFYRETEYGLPTDNSSLESYANGYNISMDIISKYYPNDDYNGYDKLTQTEILWVQMNADACLVCPTVSLASQLSVPTYMYYFEAEKYPYYLTHAGEIGFVFNQSMYDVFLQPQVNFTYKMANIANQIWTDFFKNKLDTKYFVPFTNGNGSVLNFGGSMGTHINTNFNEYHNGACNYWSKRPQLSYEFCFQLNEPINITQPNDSKLDKTWLYIITSIVSIIIIIGLIILIRKGKHKYKKDDKQFSFVNDSGNDIERI